MSTLTFYRRVIEETGQTDRAAVKRGTAAVLHALRDRLMPTEAAQAVAQLPRELKAGRSRTARRSRCTASSSTSA